jgi:hypothetical protein
MNPQLYDRYCRISAYPGTQAGGMPITTGGRACSTGQRILAKRTKKVKL